MLLIQTFTLFALVVNTNRANPTGRYLRVATLYHEPFVMPDSQSGSGFQGLLIDLMALLASKLQITVDYYVVRDGTYGHSNPNGSWSGIIGELVNNRADVGLAALTVTPTRMKVVRFSVPFITTGIIGLGRKNTFPYGQENMEELVKMAQKNKLILGTLQGGSTVSFFRDSSISTYTNVEEEMQKHPEGFVASYDEGIQKVRTSSNGKDYVFFGEKFILEHAASQQPCDLKVLTAEPLNTINYGIAFAQNVSKSVFDQFNNALLDLQTFGIVQMLKQKWTTNNCKTATNKDWCVTLLPKELGVNVKNETETNDINQFDNLVHLPNNNSSDKGFNFSQWKWKIVANLTEE